MGQMTFNFETEEEVPEKKQVAEIKEEKKAKEKKEIINSTSDKDVKKKIKSKSAKAKKTKAHQMAKEQRDIPVSEFFEQNRHILGFDNPTHSLITAVKEGVDNSLDACEQAGILPDLIIKIGNQGKDELSISIEDNGPGIIEENVPNVFGRLLYGSRFGSGNIKFTLLNFLEFKKNSLKCQGRINK